MDLQIYLTAKIVLHELVTDIERDAFADLVESLSLVKPNGREDLKRILLLDQGKFQMLPIGTHRSPIPVVNHIF